MREAGVTAQDKKVAAKIIDERKACILVVNKWDLIQSAGLEEATEKEEDRRANKKRDDTEHRLTTLAEFGGWVQEQLFFLDYAPVMFTSATTGFHLDELLENIRYVAAQLQQKIPTSLLNRTIRDSIEKRQPTSAAGHRLKFFYATQVRLAPPIFILFVNRDELFSEPYRKYLASNCAQPLGMKAARSFWCPSLAPRRWNPFAVTGTIAPKKAIRRPFPVRNRGTCSQRSAVAPGNMLKRSFHVRNRAMRPCAPRNVVARGNTRRRSSHATNRATRLLNPEERVRKIPPGLRDAVTCRPDPRNAVLKKPPVARQRAVPVPVRRRNARGLQNAKKRPANRSYLAPRQAPGPSRSNCEDDYSSCITVTD